jgi:4-hydroxy-tetrahydrodipicolinate synthase
VAFLALGGNGCISVTSNVAPGLCRSVYLALRHGQMARVQRSAASLAQLTAALFHETNPVPLKYALSLFGLMSSKVRLPLVEAGHSVQMELASVLAQLCDCYPGQMIGKICEKQIGRQSSALSSESHAR